MLRSAMRRPRDAQPSAWTAASASRSDRRDADAILIMGSNLAATMPPLVQHLAGVGARGALLYADPRDSGTAKLTADGAGPHLRLVPGARGRRHPARRVLQRQEDPSPVDSRPPHVQGAQTGGGARDRHARTARRRRWRWARRDAPPVRAGPRRRRSGSRRRTGRCGPSGRTAARSRARGRGVVTQEEVSSLDSQRVSGPLARRVADRPVQLSHAPPPVEHVPPRLAHVCPTPSPGAGFLRSLHHASSGPRHDAAQRSVWPTKRPIQ